MPLEKLEVWNFQKHKHRVFDLDPHSNSLTGPTDCGKSSILRCIRWVIFNQPAGTSFIHRDQSFAKAILTVDGHTVTRYRGKKGNWYRIDDGDKLHALEKGKAPEQVERLFNVADISIQKQTAGPYLFDRTPGKVAESLNAVVDLGLIDRTQANVSAAVRHARAAAVVSRGRLRTAKARRDELSWVVQAGADLAAVEAAESDLAADRLEAARITDLVAQASDAELKVIDLCSEVDEMFQLFSDMESIRTNVSETGKKVDMISSCFVDLQRTDKDICVSKKRLSSLMDVLSQVDICPVCGQPITKNAT